MSAATMIEQHMALYEQLLNAKHDAFPAGTHGNGPS
jgi:hypothetical protein